ncbi:hypothetical protein JHV666_49500 [Mycobacterium avium subsp. hominissuis]
MQMRRSLRDLPDSVPAVPGVRIRTYAGTLSGRSRSERRICISSRTGDRPSAAAVARGAHPHLRGPG